MRLIFLDIDGVLNDHNFCREAQSNLINPRCVANLNRILISTDARIVLSSSWRYMISGGAHTLEGFEYMLRTHGVACSGRLISVTCPDEDEDAVTRGPQIRKWLRDRSRVTSFVVIDDVDDDIVREGLPFVRTDGNVGLTEADAERVIAILTGKAATP
jgi:hypothetical protein